MDLGRPKDGLPDPIADKFLDINGAPMNPEQREYPKDFHSNWSFCNRWNVNT